MPEPNEPIPAFDARDVQAMRAMQALAPLADRWGFQIMRQVLGGVRRYGEIQRNLGISRNILAERLSTLVEAGLLRRVRYRTEPDWYEYRLTKRTADLYPTMISFYEWVDIHFGEPEHSFFDYVPHTCGLPSRPITICSACLEPVVIDPDEAVPGS